MMNDSKNIMRQPNPIWIKKAKDVLHDWQLYLLILPALVYVFTFSYWPMYGIMIAFKEFNARLGIWGSEWVGLSHFIRFVTYPDFWKILFNTLIISLYSLATFPLTIILALLLNEIGNHKLKRTVQMLTYAPHFLSTVVICGMIGLFFSRNMGLINNVIEMLGGERIDFLSKPEYFTHLYVWSGVWQDIGWGTIIYLAALSGVSPDLIEAARIDGATRLQVIRHINIPTIMPTIIIMLILSCGSILSVGFEKIYLLKNPLNSDASQVIATYLYEVGLIGGQYSYSTAIGLFNTLVNFLLLVVVNIVAKKISAISIW